MAPQAQAGGRTAAHHGGAQQRIAGGGLPGDHGGQGSRSYLFSAQRVRPSSRRKPGDIHWAVYRRNLDGSEPRYYLSNAPEATPLETLAYVGGSRWRIETEKSDVGLDEYETRTWAGWHHHVALCLLGGAFLLSLQQAWGGERCPGSLVLKSIGWCGRCCPVNGSGRLNCCGGWRRRKIITSGPNAPMPSAEPLCAHPRPFLLELSL